MQKTEPQKPHYYIETEKGEKQWIWHIQEYRVPRRAWKDN